MKKDMAQIMMNPIRLRIIQYLIMNEKGTTAQIREELCDVPTASLYRHIKILFEAGCIEVTEEKKVRGTLEKTYSLVKNPVGEMDENTAGQMIQSSLLSLMASFNKYFAREEVEPMKDMLSLSTSTLLLSDEEYMEFMEQIGQAFNHYIGNKPQEGKKARRITFISSPCEED